MQLTHDTGSRSVSPAGLYESKRYVELPGRTLPSVMVELGDERIDLLKIDIEGGEYELLPTLDLNALGVKVFALQLHHTGTVRQARSLIAALRDADYLPVACRSAVKVAFAHCEVLDRLWAPPDTDTQTPSGAEEPSRPAARRLRGRGNPRRRELARRH